MSQYIKMRTFVDTWDCECCGGIYDKTITIEYSFDKSFASIQDTFEIYIDGHFGSNSIFLNGKALNKIEGVFDYSLCDCDTFPDNLNFIFTYVLDGRYTIKTEYCENGNIMWDNYTLTDNTTNEIIYYKDHCLNDLQVQLDVVKLFQQKNIYLYLE